MALEEAFLEYGNTVEFNDMKTGERFILPSVGCSSDGNTIDCLLDSNEVFLCEKEEDRFKCVSSKSKKGIYGNRIVSPNVQEYEFWMKSICNIIDEFSEY